MIPAIKDCNYADGLVLTFSTIMVGDSLSVIDGVRNAEIRSVAVDFGYVNFDVTEFISDKIISKFIELWGVIRIMGD